MRRIYHTKFRMFYVEPGILSKIKIAWDLFVKNNGLEPKEIYMEPKDFKAYGKLLNDYHLIHDSYFYKGAEVKKL